MSDRRTDNPLESLESLCTGSEDEVVEMLGNYLKEFFYGLNSTLPAAAAQSSGSETARLHAALTRIRKSVTKIAADEQKDCDDLDGLTKIEGVKSETWERFWQLLLLYAGTRQPGDELCFNAATAIQRLTEPEDRSIDGTPLPVEVDALQTAIGKLETWGWMRPDSVRWTAADWRLLGFVQDSLSSTPAVLERTPIFIANPQTGKVLCLVGERLPGPPRLITPHWWRLGLVPLGSNNELLKAIHAGFCAVLDDGPARRYQFRWWLETSCVEDWHDDITEARSAEVSAACVAKALLEERAADMPPLLDPKAGVSGMLGGAAGTLSNDRAVDPVDYIPQKIGAAERACLLTFALSKSCATEHEGSQTPQVQPVKTVDDAYQALLATTAHLKTYKQIQAATFIPPDDLQPRSDEESNRGQYIETKTHPDFFVSADEDEHRPAKRDAETETLADIIKARIEQAPGAEHFLLGQPVWYAEAPKPNVRWNMAEREDEPTDELSKGEPAHRSAPFDGDEPLREGEAKWTRIDRDQLLQHATSDEPQWRRVGLVCGAGLGKTTNLKWLAAAINRLHQGRGKNLAVFLDVEKLHRQQNGVKSWIVEEVTNKVPDNKELTPFAVHRLLADGRVTFLLDSLDQSPEPKATVDALINLLTGSWKQCRVWLSGRPYAFRSARERLENVEHSPSWQFLRIGQLDEPECRQLLETFRRPGAA